MMPLVKAIAREEGFEIAGTRSQRNNNPGDLEFGRFTRSHGATHGDPRFAVFPTIELGFRAMRALLHSAYLGLTVEQAINKWAPPTENVTSLYVRNVCSWTGIPAEAIVTASMIDA